MTADVTNMTNDCDISMTRQRCEGIQFDFQRLPNSGSVIEALDRFLTNPGMSLRCVKTCHWCGLNHLWCKTWHGHPSCRANVRRAGTIASSCFSDAMMSPLMEVLYDWESDDLGVPLHVASDAYNIFYSCHRCNKLRCNLYAVLWQREWARPVEDI